MLASKKKQWVVIEEEQTAPTSDKGLPKVNGALRAKCFIMVIFAVTIAFFGTIRSETIVRDGYELVQMKAQVVKLEKENELLRLDIAKMKAPQRIQHIAATQLGMVLPQTVYCATTAADAPTGDSPMNGYEEKNLVNRVLNAVQSAKAEASQGR
ncbi:MAG: hypothetical protein ABFC84_13235 [Veillonellales bacterium]